jgi:hypothetical protein
MVSSRTLRLKKHSPPELQQPGRCYSTPIPFAPMFHATILQRIAQISYRFVWMIESDR